MQGCALEVRRINRKRAGEACSVAKHRRSSNCTVDFAKTALLWLSLWRVYVSPGFSRYRRSASGEKHSTDRTTIRHRCAIPELQGLGTAEYERASRNASVPLARSRQEYFRNIMFRAAQVKKVRKVSTGMAEKLFRDPDDPLASRSRGQARAQYPIIAGIDLTWLCRRASNFAPRRLRLSRKLPA